MAGNNSIKFLRGTSDKIADSTEHLVAGQPIYNEDKNYITIGDTNSNKLVKSAPITVREVVSYAGDTATGVGSNLTVQSRIATDDTSNKLMLTDDAGIELDGGEPGVKLSAGNENPASVASDVTVSDDGIELFTQHTTFTAGLVADGEKISVYAGDTAVVGCEMEIVLDKDSLEVNADGDSDSLIKVVPRGTPRGEIQLNIPFDKVVSNGQIYSYNDIHAVEGISTDGDITSSQKLEGNTIVSTSTIQAGGTVSAPNFNSTSDRNLKTDIELSSLKAKELVNNTNIYEYKFKNDLDHTNIGVIAQELEEITGTDIAFTSTNSDGYKNINLNNLVFTLWKAVQELSAEVENLKNKVDNK